MVRANQHGAAQGEANIARRVRIGVRRGWPSHSQGDQEMSERQVDRRTFLVTGARTGLAVCGACLCCERDLWRRFPDFKAQVVALRKRYLAQS